MTTNSIGFQQIAQGIAQTRYQELTYTIAAGARQEIFDVFNYFRVLNSSAALEVQFGDDAFISRFTGAGIGVRFENAPSRVTIRNPSGAPVAVTIALAMGFIYDDRLNVSGTVNIDGSVTTTTDSALNSVADVVLGAAAQTAIIAANPLRRGVIITNIGSNVVRIGDATNTGAARGARLLQDQSITLETLDAIDGYSASGTTVSVLEY